MCLLSYVPLKLYHSSIKELQLTEGRGVESTTVRSRGNIGNELQSTIDVDQRP